MSIHNTEGLPNSLTNVCLIKVVNNQYSSRVSEPQMQNQACQSGPEISLEIKINLVNVCG